jgi:hypothetical protein
MGPYRLWAAVAVGCRLGLWASGYQASGYGLWYRHVHFVTLGTLGLATIFRQIIGWHETLGLLLRGDILETTVLSAMLLRANM